VVARRGEYLIAVGQIKKCTLYSLAPCGRGQGEGSLVLKCFLPFGFGRGSGRVIASRLVGVAIQKLFVILRERAESIGCLLPFGRSLAPCGRGQGEGSLFLKCLLPIGRGRGFGRHCEGALSPRGNPETNKAFARSRIVVPSPSEGEENLLRKFGEESSRITNCCFTESEVMSLIVSPHRRGDRAINCFVVALRGEYLIAFHPYLFSPKTTTKKPYTFIYRYTAFFMTQRHDHGKIISVSVLLQITTNNQFIFC
jgi:hypothetical protein